MKTSLDTYPFLLEIPHDTLSQIDLHALHIPSLNELRLIGELAENLEKNIVVYKRAHRSTGLHLCRILQPASLTDMQLQTLTVTEKIFSEGQVVVAYEKPLLLAERDLPNQTIL
jgi:hypothetical protein